MPVRFGQSRNVGLRLAALAILAATLLAGAGSFAPTEVAGSTPGLRTLNFLHPQPGTVLHLGPDGQFSHDLRVTVLPDPAQEIGHELSLFYFPHPHSLLDPEPLLEQNVRGNIISGKLPAHKVIAPWFHLGVGWIDSESGYFWGLSIVVFAE